MATTVELINTIGTRVHVRGEHADTLLAAGYTRPDHAPQPDQPPRRRTTRARRHEPDTSTDENGTAEGAAESTE